MTARYYKNTATGSLALVTSKQKLQTSDGTQVFEMSDGGVMKTDQSQTQVVEGSYAMTNVFTDAGGKEFIHTEG
jgi:ligand-binding sensor domain-containing protein